MVAYFKREVYLFIGVGAGVGLLVALALYPGVISQQILYIRLFLAAMPVLAGVVVGRMAAVPWANRRLAALDRTLYVDCDAETYLKNFGPIVENTKADTAEAMAGHVKLAFAHEALGQFREGKAELESLDPSALKLHGMPIAANLWNQELRLALWMEDQEEIDRLTEKLTTLEAAAESRAPSLAGQLRECLHLADSWNKVLSGEDTDEAYLEDEIRLSKNRIHRSEMQLILARALLNRGDVDGAGDMLVEAKASGAGLWTAERAESMLAQL